MARAPWLKIMWAWRWQIVTPWEVEADGEEGIDYNKLIDRFGSQPITPELIARMERLTGKPAHPWLRRRVHPPTSPHPPPRVPNYTATLQCVDQCGDRTLICVCSFLHAFVCLCA